MGTVEAHLSEVTLSVEAALRSEKRPQLLYESHRPYQTRMTMRLAEMPSNAVERSERLPRSPWECAAVGGHGSLLLEKRDATQQGSAKHLVARSCFEHQAFEQSSLECVLTGSLGCDFPKTRTSHQGRLHQPYPGAPEAGCDWADDAESSCKVQRGSDHPIECAVVRGLPKALPFHSPQHLAQEWVERHRGQAVPPSAGQIADLRVTTRTVQHSVQ